MRDRGQLQKEVLQYRNRMRKLLVTLGCWDNVNHRSFAGLLRRGELACYDGTPLPDELRERLVRECARLELAEQQLAAIERTLPERLPAPVRERVTYLSRLRVSATLEQLASCLNCSGASSTTVASLVHAWDSCRSNTTAVKAVSIKASANRETDAYEASLSRRPGAGCDTNPTVRWRGGSTSAREAPARIAARDASRSSRSPCASRLHWGVS